MRIAHNDRPRGVSVYIGPLSPRFIEVLVPPKRRYRNTKAPFGTCLRYYSQVDYEASMSNGEG